MKGFEKAEDTPWERFWTHINRWRLFHLNVYQELDTFSFPLLMYLIFIIIILSMPCLLMSMPGPRGKGICLCSVPPMFVCSEWKIQYKFEIQKERNIHKGTGLFMFSFCLLSLRVLMF